jgi:hypothetical protein
MLPSGGPPRRTAPATPPSTLYSPAISSGATLYSRISNKHGLGTIVRREPAAVAAQGVGEVMFRVR